MAGRIFINYRRGDDPGFTQALYMRLEQEFDATDLFMDVEGQIKPGDDFVAVLSRQVAACDILLAVIGPRWGELMAARVGDPGDFVAIEIQAALDQEKRVIPVLVGGAAMPRADSLPESIRALARRNAVGLRPERFKNDCQGLVTALKEQLPAAERERAARTEAERKAAEAERRNREAEEAARIAATEEQARSPVGAGLSPDEIRKAEELANWDFIKSLASARDLRDHLARFPGGVTERYARSALEEVAWKGLGATPSIVTLGEFLAEFPEGEHAAQARAALGRLEGEAGVQRQALEASRREMEAWANASAQDTLLAYEKFLAQWPASAQAPVARKQIRDLSPRRIYEYSDLVYWWAIWFSALVCGVLTALFGEYVQIGGTALKIHPSPWVGVGFLAAMFTTLIFTHLRARGLHGIVLLLGAGLITSIVALVFGLRSLALPEIYFTLGHYVVVFAISFGVWLYVTFVHSRLTYGVLDPGEVGWLSPLTGQIETYRPLNFQVIKRSDDPIVHHILGLRFLGLGTGDIEFKFDVPGGGSQHHVFRNVWRPDAKLEAMERLFIRG